MVFLDLKKNQNTVNLAVALCDTMWHYVALYLCIVFCKKIRQNMVFKEIGKTLKILTIWLWHYVSLCGTISMFCFFQKRKNDVFKEIEKKHQNIENFDVALCGTVWHYIYVLFF